VSAAQAEATSAGINIVDDYNTITHINGTYTFGILRCGFNMDFFYLFAFITFLHAVYKYAWSFSPSCLWFGVSPLRVQTTENADGLNIMRRPPTGISPHFPDHWVVSDRQNLTYIPPIKYRGRRSTQVPSSYQRGPLVRDASFT
jgi:hypothetical protein